MFLNTMIYENVSHYVGKSLYEDGKNSYIVIAIVSLLGPTFIFKPGVPPNWLWACIPGVLKLFS